MLFQLVRIKMNRLLLFGIIFILTVICGCKPSKAATTVESPPVRDTFSLAGNAGTRLHNIWVVEMANGSKLVACDYSNGLPILELFVKEQRVGGNDGCNHIGGSFVATNNSISFSHITGTKMACPGMEKGVQIGMILSGKTFRYVFEKKHLILKQEGREVLVLKNID